jgi:hypothetical protein
MTSIAIYLVPVYIIVLCVLVNYIAVSTSNILAPGFYLPLLRPFEPGVTR